MPSPSASPNIVIFHCHDLGQHLGCYGRRTVHSPHIDRFAEQGMLLERSFCTAPQCSPSRASMFTGRYPHANGVMGLTHAHFGWDLNPDERHLAQYLQDAGYRTAALGVVHEARRPIDELGFDFFQLDSMAVQTVDQTIKVIQDHQGNSQAPLYIQAGCIEPHRLPDDDRVQMGFLQDHLKADQEQGLDVPGYLVDDEGGQIEIAELQGAVRHVDEQFGRLLRVIDEAGLAENTWVIFTTDHGIAMPRAKCSVYEAGLEIATIIRPPQGSGIATGRRLDALISNVDLTPTLLEIAGLPVPERMQGLSYKPVLLGETESVREAVFGEMSYHLYYDPVRSIRTDRWKLIVNFSIAPSFMDPSQSWRPRSITRTPENPANSSHDQPVELYDLQADPHEQHNLTDRPEHQATRDALLSQLAQHLQDTGDPLLQGPIPDPGYERGMAALLGQGVWSKPS